MHVPTQSMGTRKENTFPRKSVGTRKKAKAMNRRDFLKTSSLTVATSGRGRSPLRMLKLPVPPPITTTPSPSRFTIPTSSGCMEPRLEHAPAIRISHASPTDAYPPGGQLDLLARNSRFEEGFRVQVPIHSSKTVQAYIWPSGFTM